MDENDISQVLIDAAVEVHRTLGGPGLLESIYEEALAWELKQRGMAVERQKVIPVIDKGNKLEIPLRLDLLINQLVIVDCKATTQYNHIFETQVLTYLRLTVLKLGLVINFGEKLIKHWFHRIVNGLQSMVRLYSSFSGKKRIREKSDKQKK